MVDGHLIEFLNNVWGKETVKMNGQIVSQKSSVLGVQHHFTHHNGLQDDHFVVVSKLNGLSVFIDIIKNGVIVKQNLLVETGESSINKFKKSGLNFLKQYKLEEALADFVKAEAFDASDAEIPLFTACIYSLKEDVANGFRYIKKACERKLSDRSVIDTLDQLAFLRMDPAFEAFKQSGYMESPILNDK